MNEAQIIQEHFLKMQANPNLAGSFELRDGVIVWKLVEGYIVEIAPMYIGISRRLPFCRTAHTNSYHWHPEDEDLYDEVCKLGAKGNVTVIHFGWLSSCMVYSGACKHCPIKRKRLFGKYVYLYA